MSFYPACHFTQYLFNQCKLNKLTLLINLPERLFSGLYLKDLWDRLKLSHPNMSLTQYIVKWPVGLDMKVSQPNIGLCCQHKYFKSSL